VAWDVNRAKEREQPVIIIHGMVNGNVLMPVRPAQSAIFLANCPHRANARWINAYHGNI
jgi:hypothetical protein